MNKRAYKFFIIFLLILMVAVPLLRLMAGKRPSPTPNKPANSPVDDDLIAAVAKTEARLELTWQEGEHCRTAVFDAAGVTLGPCGGELTPVPYLGRVLETELARLLSAYASFTADTAAASLSFIGLGQQQASATEQESIAVWARLVADETAGEAEGLANQSALTWRVSGADTCADMVVYLTGEVDVAACEDALAAYQGQQQLDAAQMEPLFHWVYTLKPFAHEQRDEAGDLALQLNFDGRGAAEATPADQSAIAAFAAQLYAQASSGQ